MRRGDRGATMVELAITIIVVLVLIFGLVELGRYVVATSTATNASREAARYAVATGEGLNPPAKRYEDCKGMRSSAQQFGVINPPTDGQIDIEYYEPDGTTSIENCSGDTASGPLETGDRITVTVSVPYNPILPLVNIFIPSGNVDATTTRTLNIGA